ncbi:MAG: vWA domain-containing protein [Opitutales bacterium]
MKRQYLLLFSLLLCLPLAILFGGTASSATNSELATTEDSSHSEQEVVAMLRSITLKQVELEQIPLSKALDALHQQIPANKVPAFETMIKGEEPKVSVSVKNATVYQMLENIAAQTGTDWEVEDGVIRFRRSATKPAEVKEAEPETDLRELGKIKRSPEQASFAFAEPPSPAAMRAHEPGDWNREAYDRIDGNEFKEAFQSPVSTFSIDVDGASYSNVRRILNEGRLPPKDAVRVEEFINYFSYDYEGPASGSEDPFNVGVDLAESPWSPSNEIVRIAVQAKSVPWEERPSSNLVFLLDVSGSMNSPDKLSLVKKSLRLLTRRLSMNDRVAIVVYAGASGLALPSTTANNEETINHAIDSLEAAGSTAGGAGIKLAYEVARKNHIEGGTNRVILCTDGDFNVGVTDRGSLTRLVEEQADDGIDLTILGFGRGNLQDATMEELSNRGNGNYAYIDGIREARRVFLNELTGTLLTVASDVKIQVEFNPVQVRAYRLIGYENRMLEREDFDDDTKDAGEIGAGHSVTALYEIQRTEDGADASKPGELRYQTTEIADDYTDELLFVNLRYKSPGEEESTLIEVPAVTSKAKGKADADFKFALAAAAFGQLLRESTFIDPYGFDDILDLAAGGVGDDPGGFRSEFLELVEKASGLKAREKKSSESAPKHGAEGTR